MGKRARIRVYTDGGARGNPGPAAIGIVVCDEDDQLLREHKEHIGIGTNNEAEYRALIKGLEIAGEFDPEDVVVICDSELVVRQLTGIYRLTSSRMKQLSDEVRKRETPFRKVEYRHRARMTGWLERADRLVNEALDEAGF